MKKNEGSNPTPSIKVPTGKDIRETMDFSLEELYMIVGSIAFLSDNLSKSGTGAHKIRAREYDRLLRRIDNAYVDLNMKQNSAASVSLAT
ncbi:MAG TPA: hypothetical protein VKT80_18275 [Chloroflexota bacterium]|nr:hypothetical protein [Chloroflexota bacterium]